MTRGMLGERLAEDYLVSHGYTLVERNFRTRFGEIDLILYDGAYLVFAEVKLRKTRRYGAACEAVTLAKRRKLILTAEAWLARHCADAQARFDVLEVYQADHTPAKIYHLKNAFEA